MGSHRQSLPQPQSWAVSGYARCLEEHQETLGSAKSGVALYQTDAGVEAELRTLREASPGNSDTLNCACHHSWWLLSISQMYWIASQGMLSIPGAPLEIWTKIHMKMSIIPYEKKYSRPKWSYSGPNSLLMEQLYNTCDETLVILYIALSDLFDPMNNPLKEIPYPCMEAPQTAPLPHPSCLDSDELLNLPHSPSQKWLGPVFIAAWRLWGLNITSKAQNSQSFSSLILVAGQISAENPWQDWRRDADSKKVVGLSVLQKF